MILRNPLCKLWYAYYPYTF